MFLQYLYPRIHGQSPSYTLKRVHSYAYPIKGGFTWHSNVAFFPLSRATNLFFLLHLYNHQSTIYWLMVSVYMQTNAIRYRSMWRFIIVRKKKADISPQTWISMDKYYIFSMRAFPWQNQYVCYFYVALYRIFEHLIERNTR